MPALPYLQRPESQSSEKKNYRLSLTQDEPKLWRCKSFSNDDEKTKRGVIDNNANIQDVRRNKFFPDDQNDSSPLLFDRQLTGSARLPHTACPTPSSVSRHRILHNKSHNRRGLPRWVSELGRWLPPKQKLQLYQSFWKHLDLIDKSKEDMLRFERLLERFKKITEAWEAFQQQTAGLGDEHTTRLLAFRKNKDQYVDPLEGIRERREERERMEKEHQRLLEEARQQRLDEQRDSIPSIVVSDYDVDLMQLTQHTSSESENEPEGQMEVDGYEEAAEDAKEANSNERFEMEEKSSSPIPLVLEKKDNEKKEDERRSSKSTNHLSAPSLSSLDAQDNVAVEESPMSIDDTADLMTGIVPVPLGLSTGLIPDSSIRSSSSFDRYHSGAQARLNNTKKSRKGGGAWCAKNNSDKQYLEVDLGGVATLMQVATQGYPSEDEKVAKKDLRWVQSYTMTYSNDGKKWSSYREDGAVKVFEGNSDNNTVVLNSLSNPVDARYVRFCPKTWRNGIAMRVEVYGSFSDDCVSPGEAVTPNPSLPENRPTPERVPSPEPSPPPKSPSPQIPSPSPVLPSPVTKTPSPIFEVDEDVSEVEQLKCSPDRMTPLEGWEEETIGSIAELPSEEEVEDAEVRLCSPFLNVQGSRKTPKVKHKTKKPKAEKKEKKKKKPPKKKKVKLPEITSLMDALPEVEEEPEPEPEEQEEEPEPEEPYRIPTPPLPEIQKQPIDVRPPSMKKRFQMFLPQAISPSEEEKKKLARARADNSIREEMLRQQLAEERKKKLLSLTGKNKALIHSSSSTDMKTFGIDDDSFIFKYCIINESQLGYYQRIFESFDEDKDEFLFPEEILEALECVNKNLLNDSHLKYIYRALELCDCSLDSGADFKFFSVVAAFSQKIAALDDYAKIMISKLDFRELDYKLQRAKSLYKCYADEKTGQMSMELLTLELTVGGLDPKTKSHLLRSLGPTTTYLDFLDFLTYIPLFIHIHQHVLAQPLHSPVTIPVH
ncbi:uncharacterized protein LOC116299241 isoform X2 [Actinia tenebrosa]|uniref:Uncharacterized protein LOC116299241 isoform X2 n=1 Tax=Actinia tenebrosa TaxID=6105 RepID=A0A6P8IDT0_ACTTE|nr:uncharacterized protein LOC116299241 isoform X2 [Actinia tenebrosa]